MKLNFTVIICAVAAIICATIVGNAYKYKFKTTETISVTGLAEKEFESDKIVWNANYSKKSMDLKSAYAELKDDESKIKSYLAKKGVTENEMVFSAITITKDFEPKIDANGRQFGTEFTGYSLSQSVNVDSKEIEKVEKISREATELIEDGIELNSSAPSYYYSKLSELKLDLLAKASADAKQRAEVIAKNSGGNLGDIKKCNMGIFQITGLDTNEDFNSGGAFNTTSKSKKATITVRIDFGVK